MKRIICIGNRYDDRDAAGPRVYDRLASRWTPPGIEVLDGGLASLDLLRYVADAELVVFVDALRGGDYDRDVVRLTASQAANSGAHATGLTYFLRVLLQSEEEPPPVWIVGVSDSTDDLVLEEAAHAAISLAVKGDAVRLASRDMLALCHT